MRGYENSRAKAAFFPRSRNIVVPLEDTLSVFGHAVSHEYTHALQAIFAELLRDETGQIVGFKIDRHGYANKSIKRGRSLDLFNEAVTELYNIEMLHELRCSPIKRDFLTGVDLGYIAPVVVLDSIVDRVSSASGLDREMAETWIFAGAKFGEMEALQIITDSFGSKNVLHELSSFCEEDCQDFDSFEKFLQRAKLEATPIIHKLKEYFSGRPITVGGTIELIRPITS